MAVNATAIWRVRPSGSNTNGGGYDPGISGAATDYSQQNSAQASGTHGTASGTTAFSDTTAAAFTSAMVGNALYITGTGLTTGFYFCTAFIDASHITIDRSPGTGTTGTWHLGGGWADFWTNTDTSGNFGTNGATWIKPGNIIYILGSGTPNPASYSYDYTISTYFITPFGSDTVGWISYANDPATPGYKASPNTTGGMPCISCNGLLISGSSNSWTKLVGLWCVPSSASNGGSGLINNNVIDVQGVVLDQNSFDISLNAQISGASNITGCEIFSSVSPGSSGSNALQIGEGGNVIGCNVHDTVGPGITTNNGSQYLNNIIAKCRGYGMQAANQSDTKATVIMNNTIDGNLGNGIEMSASQPIAEYVIMNNIISNHTQAGTFGLKADANTAAQNELLKRLMDFNVFYNNTSNYSAISAGPHDTALGSNPYVGQSSENYTLS